MRAGRRGSFQPWSATAFLVLLAAAGCHDREPDSSGVAVSRPDVVLISIDSLRPDHLGAYGYGPATSPAMDALAADAVVFEHAVSTTSWTLPAHAAMFTGLFDSAHGLYDNGRRLADSYVTMAEVLRDNGYRTAGFFGGPYLHQTFGLAQGFDHWESCMTRLDDDLGDQTVRAAAMASRGASHHDITGPRTLERVRAWLGGVDPRPFFLFIHLWDVH